MSSPQFATGLQPYSEMSAPCGNKCAAVSQYFLGWGYIYTSYGNNVIILDNAPQQYQLIPDADINNGLLPPGGLNVGWWPDAPGQEFAGANWAVISSRSSPCLTSCSQKIGTMVEAPYNTYQLFGTLNLPQVGLAKLAGLTYGTWWIVIGLPYNMSWTLFNNLVKSQTSPETGSLDVWTPTFYAPSALFTHPSISGDLTHPGQIESWLLGGVLPALEANISATVDGDAATIDWSDSNVAGINGVWSVLNVYHNGASPGDSALVDACSKQFFFASNGINIGPAGNTYNDGGGADPDGAYTWDGNNYVIIGKLTVGPGQVGAVNFPAIAGLDYVVGAFNASVCACTWMQPFVKPLT